MLILYNKNALPKDKEDIKFPWDTYFEDNKVTKYFDKTDEKIIKDVEKTNLINEFGTVSIYGKFSDKPISLGCLSDGCKTLLAINHAIKNSTTDKYIFNISDCGRNAVKYLIEDIAKDIDVNAYIEHYSLGLSRNCQLRVGDKTFDNTLEASSEIMRIQTYYDDEEV